MAGLDAGAAAAQVALERGERAVRGAPPGHRPRVRPPACSRSSRCRTSPRAATGRRSTRSARRSRRTRGCSTCTRTPITTARYSRSSARTRPLVEALVAAVEVARERIDLRRHEGAHPRIGAADVVPLVPVRQTDMERARQAALALGERLGALGLPVFVYAPPVRGPAFYRRGGVEELAAAARRGRARARLRPGAARSRGGRRDRRRAARR